MRIRGRLLLSYIVLIALFTSVAALVVPRLVERVLVRAEERRLQGEATALAEKVKNRARFFLSKDLTDAMISEETISIVNPKKVIQFSTEPTLVGKPLKRLTEQETMLNTDGLAELEGVGPVITAMAPIQTEEARAQGWQILMVRRLDIVKQVARSISFSLVPVVAIGLIAALLFAGWLSGGMVNRLRATGDAARALAEGDLSQRAPEEGKDEITELAQHFNHMAERIEALVAGLRRSEGSRKELLIMVSHELRTPLTSINGFAEALRDGVVHDEERKQRYYELISNESARMNRLINDLFDVAKLDAGQADLNLQAMSVASWLVEFAESFRPGDAKLDVVIDEAAEAARIYGDRDRLDQVLTNLAANAVRFSPAGGTVTLNATVQGDDVLISVTDEGPGLTPVEAQRVFDRFFQGRNQASGYKGAGLGLAIVASLVKAHGGQVGVNSTPGQGATFWFRLKRLKA